MTTDKTADAYWAWINALNALSFATLDHARTKRSASDGCGCGDCEQYREVQRLRNEYRRLCGIKENRYSRRDPR